MHKYLAIILILFLASCEQYFVPDIEKQESSLVFEGYITNLYDAHLIKISRTYSFNEDSIFETVSNFDVTIEDEFGNSIQFSETTPGYYFSDSISGALGTKYRMVAASPTGKIYNSEWELLSPSAGIDSITGKYDIKKFLRYHENVGYAEEEAPGVMVLNDADTKGFTPFYRYEYKIVFLSSQYYPSPPSGTLIFIARPKTSTYTDYVSVVNANKYDKQFIKNNEVKFISAGEMLYKLRVDSLELDENREPLYDSTKIKYMQRGFLIELSQYSLTEKAFQFWEAINKQTSSTGQIFDPVQSQVLSNVYCLNDSTEQVFGYFSASAVTKKAMFLNLRANNLVDVEPVVYFPNLRRIIVSYSKFDFWVE